MGRLHRHVCRPTLRWNFLPGGCVDVVVFGNKKLRQLYERGSNKVPEDREDQEETRYENIPKV